MVRDTQQQGQPRNNSSDMHRSPGSSAPQLAAQTSSSPSPQPRCHPAPLPTQHIGFAAPQSFRNSPNLSQSLNLASHQHTHNQPPFCTPPDGDSRHQRQECHLRDVVLSFSEINSLKTLLSWPQEKFHHPDFFPPSLLLLVCQAFHSTFIMLSMLQGAHHSQLPSCPSSLMEMLIRKEQTRQSC